MASRHRRSLPLPVSGSCMTNSDLKRRVIASLNKLSDRDTRGLAIGELEAVAKSLSSDNLSTFVSCLYQTDSSSKPTVRRQIVVLLSTLSSSHGIMLVPCLAKLISTLTRRLGDSDSAVRAACVSAAASLSSFTAVDGSSSSLLFNSLLQVLSAEQEFNSQIGAAMCLEAVIDAAPEMNTELLRMALPKLRKLVISEGFKPKAALLGVIGSIVSAGATSARSFLDWLVPCLVNFLSNEDWVARKAAAEALGRVAMKESELAKEYKDLCLCSLENRRFDKVKVVRETMNHTLALWKGIPEDTTDDELSSVESSPLTKLSGSSQASSSSSSPSSEASCVTTDTTHDQKQTHSNGETEAKSVLVRTVRSPRPKRCGTKVVPLMDDESFTEDDNEIEDLSLIHDQLNQIENQQSNLIHFLQTVIGKSRSGINSLETRLNGVEKALNEISYDMELSNGKFQLPYSTFNLCYSLPRSDFSSYKTRRRAQARHFTQITNRRASCGPFMNPLRYGGSRRRDSFSPELLLNSIHGDVRSSTCITLQNQQAC